ncbi:chlorohydrolase [Streptococcus pneumoniae]|nr:chlorohydrolase [Streptococcus pneumoniae]
MKIKEQTRQLAVSCSKYIFEVADKTDEVSSKHCFEVQISAQNTVLRWQIELTKPAHTYTAKAEWFEEILFFIWCEDHRLRVLSSCSDHERCSMINPLYSSKLNLYLPLLNCLFLILNCYLSNSFFLIKFSSSKTSGKKRIVSDNIFIRNKFICHFKKE